MSEPKKRVKSQEPRVKKSEVGVPNAEVKPKVERPKPKAKENSAIDTPQSELNKSEIENPTSEITPMEVHHHPDLHHKEKPWKEYILEGLMIFVAVTMGFFAETFRESITENHTAYEYARSMVEDLKKDMAQLDTGMRELNFMSKRLDTLVELVHSKQINSLPGGTWYYYGRFGSFSTGFQSVNATLGQLKSSGALRFFKDPKLINAIAQYDYSSQELYEFNNRLEYKASIIQLRNKIFDAYYFIPIMDIDISRQSVSTFKQRSIPLLGNDHTMLIEYANYCQLKSSDSKYMLGMEIELLAKAKNLLKLLNEEYE